MSLTEPPCSGGSEERVSRPWEADSAFGSRRTFPDAPRTHCAVTPIGPGDVVGVAVHERADDQECCSICSLRGGAGAATPQVPASDGNDDLVHANCGALNDAPDDTPASWVPHSRHIKTNQTDHDVFRLSHPDVMLYCTNTTSTSLDESFHEEDNDLLRYLRRDRKNVVLDSPDPLRAPHIVISPVQDTWDDYYTPFQNRVNSQWSDSLMVPQPVHGYDSRAYLVSAELDATAGAIGPEDYALAPRESFFEQPNKVFSLPKFQQLINSSSAERLIMYYVVIALFKNQYKVSAYSASNIAASFRRRYDSPSFLHTLEKPFQWSDPAEPLLLDAQYSLGTTVIESDHPFTVPHIVISSPPPQDPWIAWANATPDPQDCVHGRRLTVPSRAVMFINAHAPRADDDCAAAVPELVMDTPGCASRADTPAPTTPRGDTGAATLSQLGPVPGAAEPGLGHTCVDAVRTSCVVFLGDEDDLPPFDEWYQRSASHTVAAAA